MGTVQDIIDAADTRLATAIADSYTFTVALETLASSFDDYATITINNQNITGLSNVSSNPPGLDSLQRTTEPSVPSTPSTISASLWNKPIPPDFNASIDSVAVSPPTLITPIAPAHYDTSRLDVIAAPDITRDIPDTPIINPPSIPDLSNVDVPVWDISAPELDFLAPTNNFTFTEEERTSDLSDVITTVLLNDLVDGGYGINVDDEQALFDRARDREEQSVLVAENELSNVYAARGFPMPPGAMLAINQKVLEQRQAQLSGVNRDIMIKRSDMFVQARQFAIQQGMGWEQMFFNLQNSKMERSLNYQRSVADFALQYYNAAVAQLNIKIQLYDALGQGFQRQVAATQVQLEQSRVEIAKGELEIRREGLTLDAHKTNLERSQLIHDYYETQIKVTNNELDIERTRLEAYKQQIEVFLAQVRGGSFELDKFRVTVDAEKLKLEQFRNEILSHNAKVDTAKAKSQIENERYRAEIDTKVADLRRTAQEIDKYQIQLKAAFDDAGLAARANDQTLDSWKRHTSVFEGNRDASLQVAIANQRGQLDVLRMNIQQLKNEYDYNINSASTRRAAAESGLDLYENMISALAASINSIATLAEEAA